MTPGTHDSTPVKSFGHRRDRCLVTTTQLRIKEQDVSIDSKRYLRLLDVNRGRADESA